MTRPTAPNPTPDLAALVNLSRDRINGCRERTTRIASQAELATAFDDYTLACVAAGVPAPPPLDVWPAPSFGIKSPGDQRRTNPLKGAAR